MPRVDKFLFYNYILEPKQINENFKSASELYLPIDKKKHKSKVEWYKVYKDYWKDADAACVTG